MARRHPHKDDHTHPPVQPVAWTRADIVQHIIDSRWPRTGWQAIADDLNEREQRDLDGARWTGLRVRRVHEAHPHIEPGFMQRQRSDPPSRNVLDDYEQRDEGHYDDLPDTVVGRRRLWTHIKG